MEGFTKVDVKNDIKFEFNKDLKKVSDKLQGIYLGCDVVNTNSTMLERLHKIKIGDKITYLPPHYDLNQKLIKVLPEKEVIIEYTEDKDFGLNRKLAVFSVYYK